MQPADVKAKVLSAILKSNQPLSFAQVLERSGMAEAAARSALQQLVREEKIQAEGATKARRYSRRSQAPHSAHGARTAAGHERNNSQMDAATQRIGLRDRVLKAIAGDPESLTEHRLAQALGADVVDIAAACEWLADRNKIVCHADSTYSIRERVAA